MITLASPLGRNPQARKLQSSYDLVNKGGVDEIDDEMVMRIRAPLPVPSSAIYSRTDGIVAWQSCVEEVLTDSNENVEVLGSHSGRGFNLQVLWVIADRLAQSADDWRPMGSLYGRLPSSGRRAS